MVSLRLSLIDWLSSALLNSSCGSPTYDGVHWRTNILGSDRIGLLSYGAPACGLTGAKTSGGDTCSPIEGLAGPPVVRVCANTERLGIAIKKIAMAGKMRPRVWIRLGGLEVSA